MEGYKPNGLLLWDSWFVKRGNEYHVFYLQARPLSDPKKRPENNVSIGHAVSQDLVSWTELPTALVPGVGWDNLALWTGCVIQKGDTYFMFYTGRHISEEWIQKIGLATSKDLISWNKYEHNPVLEAGGEYHSTNEKNDLGNIGAFRDPFIFQDGKYFMLITAKTSEKVYDGCIGIAESDDLFNWKLRSPLLAPGVFDEMEVPQLIVHNNLYYLFFSTHDYNYHPDYAKRDGAFGGLHCYYSESLFGEYKPVNGNGVVHSNENEIYSLKIIDGEGNEFTAIGWRNRDFNGTFIGSLSEPIKMEIVGDRITLL